MSPSYPSSEVNEEPLFDNGKPHDGSVPFDGCVKVGYTDANVIDGPGMTDFAHILYGNR